MKRLFTLVTILLQFVVLGQSIEQFTGLEVNGKQYTILTANYTLKVEFYSPSVVKCEFIPFESTVFDSSRVVIANPIENFSVSFNEAADRLFFETDSIKVQIMKYPVRLTYFDAAGNTLLEEDESLGHRIEGNTAAIYYEYQNGTCVYGSGETGTSLDLSGGTYSFYNTQAYGYHGAPGVMAVNVPFITTNKGFGVYFDSHLPSELNVGDNSSNIRFGTEREHLRYYFIYGSDYASQLEKYTWLTGRQPMPPKWALGYIQSRYGYRTESEARSMVSTMRSKNIPLDVIVLDWNWQNEMGDLDWSASAFPTPFNMMQDFMDTGVKTVAITEPYVTQYADKYNTAYNNGYFASNEDGEPYMLGGWWSCNCDAGLIDMTNPEVALWWWDQHSTFMGGVMAGLWTDLGEPERHPSDMIHYGGSADEVHNLFNNYWAETIFNGLASDRPNERVFNLTRAGFAGIQRFGVFTWSGDVGADWSGLEPQIAIMLNCAMSGIAFEHSDLGGFCCGNPNGNLHTRWMQMGTFSPIMRAHGVDSDPQEPWGYGSSYERFCKKAIELRYSLLPYNYTMIRKTCDKGIPITRPLSWEVPDNTSLFNNQSGYFWGDDMLVFPIVATGNSKNITLPSGGWINYHTNQKYGAAGNYTVSSDMNQIPVYIREGAIIPTAPVRNYIGETPDDTVIVKCYPANGLNKDFVLYEDDGTSNSYTIGEYSETLLSLLMADSAVIFDIGNMSGEYANKPSERTWLVEFNGIHNAERVVVNNNDAAQYYSLPELRNAEVGYYREISGSIGKMYVQVSSSTARSNNIVLKDASTGIEDRGVAVEQFSLAQNYPNPFNPETTIRFNLPQSETVSLKVYNTLGELVTTLINKEVESGEHTVKWNGLDKHGNKVASGMYIYRISAGEYEFARKMIMLK